MPKCFGWLRAADAVAQVLRTHRAAANVYLWGNVPNAEAARPNFPYFFSPDTDRILRILGVLGVFGAYSTSRIFPDLEYGPNFPYFPCSLAYLPPLSV